MDKNALRNIIERCKSNDRVAQEQLYRSFFGLFYTIAQDYVHDREITLEIINEAFLKIFMNLTSFDEKKGPFEAWSKRILQNVCIDIYRKEKRQPHLEELSDMDVQDFFSVQNQSKFFSEDTHQLFQKLPETTRKVCQLFLIEGYNHKEIGKIMNMNENTSRWHLMEGKKKLRDLLKAHG